MSILYFILLALLFLSICSNNFLKYCSAEYNLNFYSQIGLINYLFHTSCKDMEIALYSSDQCATSPAIVTKEDLSKYENISIFQSSDLNLIQKLPHYLHFILLQDISSCSEVYELLNTAYSGLFPNIQFIDTNTKFLIIDATRSRTNQHPELQYYDLGSIIYQNSINKISLDYISYEIRKSNSLYLNLGKSNNSYDINLKENDLELVYVKILYRPFLGEKIVHNLLSVCTTNGQTAYYFIIDRGAIHYDLYTKIRLIYYHSSSDNDCDPDSPYWPENITGNMTKYLDGGIALSDRRSLRSLLVANEQYVNDYEFYEIAAANCQHYATGMFNAITGKNIEFMNFNLYSIKRPNFSYYWDSRFLAYLY
jgi:hypothetical protein